MKRNPHYYVVKKFNVSKDELQVVCVKYTTKWDCSGPSWSHYSWEEPESAVIVHVKTGDLYLVTEDYEDKAHNIYRVSVTKWALDGFTDDVANRIRNKLQKGEKITKKDLPKFMRYWC